MDKRSDTKFSFIVNVPKDVNTLPKEIFSRIDDYLKFLTSTFISIDKRAKWCAVNEYTVCMLKSAKDIPDYLYVWLIQLILDYLSPELEKKSGVVSVTVSTRDGGDNIFISVSTDDYEEELRFSQVTNEDVEFTITNYKESLEEEKNNNEE